MAQVKRQFVGLFDPWDNPGRFGDAPWPVSPDEGSAFTSDESFFPFWGDAVGCFLLFVFHLLLLF